MKRYDLEGGKDRADLLAWLKGEMNKGNTDLGPRELFTHISSNLYVVLAAWDGAFS